MISEKSGVGDRLFLRGCPALWGAGVSDNEDDNGHADIDHSHRWTALARTDFGTLRFGILSCVLCLGNDTPTDEQ